MSSHRNAAPEIPVLETERLILRGHRLTDFEACVAMWGDEGVTRFIGGKPFTQEETWSRLLRYAGHWAHLGFGFWAIEEKASGAFMGELGFAEFKRDIKPPLTGMPEAGWALASAAQGKGYAREALGAALAWGDAHFSGRTVCCIISPQNAPSIRVAEKCGFREAARTTYKGSPTIIFKR